MDFVSANLCQWRGQSPHYEVWYLTFTEPDQGVGIWIRYTLTVPRQRMDGYSAVWFSFFDAQHPENSWGLRQACPLDTYRAHPSGGIATDYGAFEGRRLTGRLHSPDHHAEWELEIEEGAIPVYRPLPDWAYRSPFVPSRLTNVALSASVSGKVVIDGRTYSFSRAPGCQSHHWGRHLPKRWVWCHCSAFSTSRLPLFEGLTLYLPLLPPLSVIGLWLPDGGQTPVHIPVRSLREALRVETTAEFPRWSTRFIKGSHRYTLSVSAPPERFLRAIYDNPTGGQVFCHNTEIADAELRVEHKPSGAWQTVACWQAPHSAFLEFGTPTPIPEVSREIVQL